MDLQAEGGSRWEALPPYCSAISGVKHANLLWARHARFARNCRGAGCQPAICVQDHNIHRLAACATGTASATCSCFSRCTSVATPCPTTCERLPRRCPFRLSRTQSAPPSATDRGQLPLAAHEAMPATWTGPCRRRGWGREGALANSMGSDGRGDKQARSRSRRFAAAVATTHGIGCAGPSP